MYENTPQYQYLQQQAMQQGQQPQAPQMPQGGSNQMDPRMLDLMIEQQKQALQQPAMQRQFKLAEQLRADQRGGLQGVQAGRRYVAPGALNLIGNIGQSFMGAQQQGQGEEQAGKFANTSGAALNDVLKYWRQRQAAQSPGMQQQVQGVQMPDYSQ